MAWNPSPKVAQIRDYAKKYKKNMVILVGFDEETFEIVTYGKTRLLCDTAKKLGDEIFELLDVE